MVTMTPRTIFSRSYTVQSVLCFTLLPMPRNFTFILVCYCYNWIELTMISWAQISRTFCIVLHPHHGHSQVDLSLLTHSNENQALSQRFPRLFTSTHDEAEDWWFEMLWQKLFNAESSTTDSFVAFVADLGSCKFSLLIFFEYAFVLRSNLVMRSGELQCV